MIRSLKPESLALKFLMEQNILNKLSEVGGTGTESGTLLGDIFRAAEKTSAILQSITNLGILGQSDNSTTENAFLDDPEVKGGSHSGMLFEESARGFKQFFDSKERKLFLCVHTLV